VRRFLGLDLLWLRTEGTLANGVRLAHRLYNIGANAISSMRYALMRRDCIFTPPSAPAGVSARGTRAIPASLKASQWEARPPSDSLTPAGEGRALIYRSPRRVPNRRAQLSRSDGVIREWGKKKKKNRKRAIFCSPARHLHQHEQLPRQFRAHEAACASHRRALS